MSDDRCQSSILLHLPDILLEKILGYLSFNEVANLRIVCHKFNDVNKQILNRGFRAVEHYHLKCQKEVKSQLPRRESERRDHPLAHHCNILSGIETRLSLLNMTFLKYVDAKLCCFIPGKVIDEIYRVLCFVQNTKNLFINGNTSCDAKNIILKELRANVILKELRDISSMAMEHFEEKILPAFKAPSASPLLSFYSSSPPHFSPSVSSFISLSPSSGGTPSLDPQNMSPEQFGHLGKHLKMYNKQNKNNINSMKRQLSSLQNKLGEACRKICEQEQVVLELNRVLSEQNSKLSDHENKLTEVNRKLLESEKKMAAFLNLVSCSGGTISIGTSLKADNEKYVHATSATKSITHGTNIGASTSGLQVIPSTSQKMQPILHPQKNKVALHMNTGGGGVFSHHTSMQLPFSANDDVIGESLLLKNVLENSTVELKDTKNQLKDLDEFKDPISGPSNDFPTTRARKKRRAQFRATKEQKKKKMR